MLTVASNKKKKKKIKEKKSMDITERVLSHCVNTRDIHKKNVDLKFKCSYNSTDV